MSTAEEYSLFKFAVVAKPYGSDGECLISILDTEPEALELTEPVFIDFDGLPVPFFIKEINPKGSKRYLVKFIGVNSQEDADEIVGKTLFRKLSKDDYQTQELEPSEFYDMLFLEDGSLNSENLELLENWEIFDISSESAKIIQEHSLLSDENDEAILLKKLFDASTLAGKVIGHENIACNPCLYIEKTSSTDAEPVMIPFHDDLIAAIDVENHKILMAIPEGLI